ncbi:MAG: hypothetical protein ABFQ62_01760 [Patescibacteria group bacterium]
MKLSFSALKKNSHLILLSLIFILALISRFYKLTEIPKAVAADEVALVYNGWSLITTGKDEWGKTLPLVLRSFDDNKAAIYSYLTIPGILIFDVNVLTARLPAALFGSFLPIILYFIFTKLSKNKTLSLLTALVVVTSPWHIEISRTAIEAGVALTLAMMSLLALLQKDKRWHWTSVILLILSLYTYHTARLIAPIILLAAVFFKQIKTTRKFNIILIIIFILGIFLSLTQSSDRFKQISIFSDQGAKLLREEAIREDGGLVKTNLIESRAFHNKPLSWVTSFTQSYVSNTSLSFLFLGGAQPPRVTIPETGQFLIIFLPFFIIGLGASAKNWKNFDKFVLLWLALAPIPASLTTAELPHTYRTLFMLPPIAFFIAQGLTKTFKFIKTEVVKDKKVIFWFINSGFLILMLFNFLKTWHQYRVHQQVHQPWYRQYGYKDLVDFLNTIKNKERITITNKEGEPYIFILLYNKITPKKFHAANQKRLAHKAIEAGADEWQLFNYTFSEAACPYDVTDNNPNNYYVVHFNCELPKNFVRVKSINFMDGEPEFQVDRPMTETELIEATNAIPAS